MNIRDILREVFEQKLTAEQADEVLANVLDSPEAGNVESLLMLTRSEWTGYGHGATLADLARWRYHGWPTQCGRCGREIKVEKFGWKVIEADGVVTLRHIHCP
jgi:hypothetical protein